MPAAHPMPLQLASYPAANDLQLPNLSPTASNSQLPNRPRSVQVQAGGDPGQHGDGRVPPHPHATTEPAAATTATAADGLEVVGTGSSSCSGRNT